MKKLFVKSLAVLIIFVLLAPPASADFNWPSPATTASQMLNKILSQLGFDQDEIQYAAKTFNESRQKKQPPLVSLSFEPSNPAPGEKMTAVAQPSYFLNDSSRLYFTWYLKHASNNRDLNGDGRINIEDYKIEAARIIASNDFEWERADYTFSSDDDEYEAYFGGDDQRGKEAHCFYHDTVSGNELEISCQHVFPDDELPGDLGDENFGVDREAFWHTDPTNSDTRGTGNTDEANVIGLGINQFTWNYQPGDQVGVAVEGISFDPAQTDDSSYRTMWALLKNKCSAFDSDVEDIEDLFPNTAATENTTTTDTTTDTQTSDPDPITGYVTEVVTETITTTTRDVVSFQETTTIEINITTTVFADGTKLVTISGPTTTSSSTTTTDTYTTDQDLNDCLDENFIDPVEGGATNKIEVSLDALPTAPVNDPNGNSSDELVVQASTVNTKDKQFLKYTWQVYGSDNPNPESWGVPYLKSELPGVNQTTGIGLSTFKMKLSMQSPQRYLKVKVTVSEKTASGVEREGHTDIVVTLYSSTNQIHVYPASVNDASYLELATDRERCNTAMEKIVCPVVKNEIVGLFVPAAAEGLTDFLWTLDNRPLTPINYGPEVVACSSGECDPTTGEATNIAYFPVLKEQGEKYTVNFSATNAQGQKLSLVKTFEVVEPKVSLISDDREICEPILLGNYVDLNEKLWPDYSENSFEAVAGQMISIKPVLNMPFATGAQWYIDNIAIDTDTATLFGASITNDGVLTFPANKPLGETYSVGYTAIYNQETRTKQLLNSAYGVQLNEFYEKQLGTAIEITVVASLSDTPVAQAPTSKKIIAALITDVPAYFGFLFRLVLTAGLLLFVSWAIFSLFPKTTDE